MEDKRDNPQELLRTSGAAAITGLSVSTLNKLRCSGGGPAFLKLGRAVRYKPVDLKDWLDSSACHEHVRNRDRSAGRQLVGKA